MEKKNGDDEREEKEQLTLQQNKYYPHRPLSNCISVDYPVSFWYLFILFFLFKYFLLIKINKNSRRKTTNDNDHRYPPIILPSERNSLQMKSSTLPQYTSNPALIVKNRKTEIYDEEPSISTYSLQLKTNKLQHAKSHGELYQPSTSLSLSPAIKTNNDENKTKYREKYSSDSPVTVTPAKNRSTATTVTSLNVTQSSSSNKIPLWKRLKKMIVPTKRNKDRQNSSKIPPLLLDELLENESSKNI
jgi:hypothetical protein